MERNQRFASAFGIAPDSQRVPQAAPNTGRFYGDGPDARGSYAKNDGGQAAFADELMSSTYSEALLRWCRENTGDVLKLERRWVEFITDAASASCQLKPMMRSERILVHEYSDHWRFHTESFEREPNRYMSCVKVSASEPRRRACGRSGGGRSEPRERKEELMGAAVARSRARVTALPSLPFRFAPPQPHPPPPPPRCATRAFRRCF
jgi:hypothetical protein